MLADEDELQGDDEVGLEELVDDALLTDALMGWDGDPCQCAVCNCPRFRDGADPLLCRECLAGAHPGARPNAPQPGPRAIETSAWHVPPPNADWTAHEVGPDCLAHMDAASRGEVPYGGHLEDEAPGEAIPEWRRRMADRPPVGDWWKRRHHCSDVVMGGHPDETGDSA